MIWLMQDWNNHAVMEVTGGIPGQGDPGNLGRLDQGEPPPGAVLVATVDADHALAGLSGPQVGPVAGLVDLLTVQPAPRAG